MNVKNFTEDALVKELRKKSASIIYSKTSYLDPMTHK